MLRGLFVLLGALVALPVPSGSGAQQPDRRTLDAAIRTARQACTAPVDSGSIADALSRLNEVAAQDPNYPELKSLQERCGQEFKKQRAQEEATLAEAKSAYERRAFDEARYKFKWLADRNTPFSAEAKRYLSQIVSAGPGVASPASQQDYDSLEMGKKYYKSNDYEKARQYLEPLVHKGGPVAPEARKYLDLIEVRKKSLSQLAQGMQLQRQRRHQEALAIFQSVQQQDPECPGLGNLMSQSQAALAKAQPAPPAHPAFQRAKTLFEQGDPRAALNLFRELQSAQPDLPDLQAWIQKTETAIKEQEKQNRLERIVNDGEALLRRKEYARAFLQFRRALALAPGDEEIRRLVAEAEAGMKKAGQTVGSEDRSAFLATYLENGVREFYAGNLAETNRLLEQYIRENGKHIALAYFYLGAAASTEFFLGGGKDRDKEARAQQFFARGRQAQPRFDPPRDWVSPKIVALYDRTAPAR